MWCACGMASWAAVRPMGHERVTRRLEPGRSCTGRQGCPSALRGLDCLRRCHMGCRPAGRVGDRCLVTRRGAWSPAVASPPWRPIPAGTLSTRRSKGSSRPILACAKGWTRPCARSSVARRPGRPRGGAPDHRPPQERFTLSRQRSFRVLWRRRALSQLTALLGARSWTGGGNR